MPETLTGHQGNDNFPASGVPRLPRLYVWELIFGFIVIAGIAAYVIHRDYRSTLALWRSRLTGEVVSRVWILRNSLQESRDDTQVLADFPSTKELLLLGKGGRGGSVSRDALLKQVTGLFDEYRRVYEYAAVCLADPEGHVVVEATDLAAWGGVIESQQFKDLVRAAVRNRQHTVDTIPTSAEERTMIFAMPVWAKAAAGELRSAAASPVGAVVILDPLARELLPLLNEARNSTRTGEALLLWSQNGEGRYASPRRYHEPESDLPAASSDTLKQTVRIAVEDHAVFGQFLDYRSVPVLAVALKIPSLAGVVVIKVDRAEALADFLRAVRLQVIAATAILIVYAGTILWLRRSAIGREMMGRIAQQQAILAERQRTEELLRAVNATLETRVTERTAQLASANEQLRLELDERARAERALRTSEERYRELIENARDIIYTHDLEGRFTSLNRMGEESLGYTREEILNLNILDVAGPEYNEFLQQLTRTPRADREASTYELGMTSKEGVRLTMEISPRVIYENGKAVRVQGIARDLTERKKLENQLIQAQKMEAVGQLAGGVAHDFNNLLTIILGYCEELSEQFSKESPVAQQLTEIWTAGKRAASLTAQLLAFSRQKAVNPEVLDMSEVVSEMESMLRRAIGEGIHLTTKLDGDLGQVKADRGQVEQAILNMAVNARDAMPMGGSLTIELASANESSAPPKLPVKPGPYVMLKVRDSGQGMDAQTQARVFEPFFTTKEPGRGTGLGLAMVYGTVKQAGGYIWLESAPGQGTTFNIILPQQEGSAASGSKAELAPTALPRGTETILLVEDEEMVRGLLRKTLEKCGYKVFEGRHGEEGLQTAGQISEPIHLLVTDIVMPRMGGPELARRLTSSRPEMRVLFMSGYAGGAPGHDPALVKGAVLLQKPFSPEVLVRKVREILDQKRPATVVDPPS